MGCSLKCRGPCRQTSCGGGNTPPGGYGLGCRAPSVKQRILLSFTYIKLHTHFTIIFPVLYLLDSRFVWVLTDSVQGSRFVGLPPVTCHVFHNDLW